MAQAGFTLAAVLALSFFLWRWKLDPLSVAFGSSLIYFLPGFFGVALFSYGQGLGEFATPIVPGAYAAMVIVLAALVAGAVLIDPVEPRHKWHADFQSNLPIVFLAFATVATIVTVAHTGTYFLCLDKNVTLGKIDAWYSYAAISVPFLVATAYAERRRAMAIAGCAFLLADIYAGFRMATGITFLATIMLSGAHIGRGKKAVATFLLVVALAGASLFILKALIAPAKYATSSYCPVPSSPDQRSTREMLWGTMGNFARLRFYFAVFASQAEPFVIQATLNEVVRKDFHIGADNLTSQVLTAVPFGKTLFGIDSSAVSTFNSIAQPALFPTVKFSMASNPWAQAYATGGLWMVAAFAAGYAALLALLTVLFRSTDGAIKAGVAVIGVWIGFYFHRNDIFTEIIYVKHAVYMFGLALVAASLATVLPTFTAPARG